MTKNTGPDTQEPSAEEAAKHTYQKAQEALKQLEAEDDSVQIQLVTARRSLDAEAILDCRHRLAELPEALWLAEAHALKAELLWLDEVLKRLARERGEALENIGKAKLEREGCHRRAGQALAESKFEEYKRLIQDGNRVLGDAIGAHQGSEQREREHHARRGECARKLQQLLERETPGRKAS